MSVSVVIPTYNRAAMLRRCLASLVDAKVPELEIVVVDDGGADDSEAVCRHFGARYIRQTNAGPAMARNRGIESCTGRYVAFIDSDDEWINGGVGRLVTQLDANPDVSVLFADSAMGNPESGFVSFVGTYGGSAFETLPADKRAGVRVLERTPFLLQLSTRNVMFLGSMLFRREALQVLRGFDVALCGAADWDVFMRATVEAPVGYSAGPPISRYYKHDEGMSTNADHMSEDFIMALDSVRRRCALDQRERKHVDARVKDHVFGWAYGAYDAGNFLAARQRLKLGLRLGQFGPREALFLCATYFPSQFIAALRRTRHALGL